MNHVPSKAQQALDAEVEARKARLAKEGHAGEIERRDSLVPTDPDGVLPIAEVMPDALAVFERMAQKAEQFFDEMRPQVAAAPQAIPCQEHPETLRSIDFDLSCRESRESGRFVAAYAPCAVCVALEAKARQRAFWSRRGVPERVLDATFANFRTDTPEKGEAVGKVREWTKRRGNFLLLIGTTGTGKGHLASAALKAGGAGLWIEHVNMLADLRASYTLHTTSELIVTWQEAEMFVLDEFGLSPGGKDEEPLLYQVLAARYDKRRPTIITSNMEKSALREAIGFRLLDRIREDVVEISMKWPSYRTAR